jgi:hypothetical protein
MIQIFPLRERASPPLPQLDLVADLVVRLTPPIVSTASARYFARSAVAAALAVAVPVAMYFE